MTSKLTRERIEQYANDLRMCNINDEIRELARMALAAMDSEPVAYMYDGEDGVEYNGHNEFSGGGKGVPLYRHAPPSPEVLDEAQSREAFEKWCQVNIERNKWHPEFYAHLPAREQWAAWEACRAAMLQAGNSPVIPDGYVMVPKEPTAAMISAWLSEVANWRGHVAGYKAMLAAAQKEVK